MLLVTAVNCIVLLKHISTNKTVDPGLIQRNFFALGQVTPKGTSRNFTGFSLNLVIWQITKEKLLPHKKKKMNNRNKLVMKH